MPKKIADGFERLKKENPPRLVLKMINGKYYVYRERGVWLKNLRKNKTLSEYLGRVTDEGAFIKKALHARNDIGSAKALIEQHGGEIIWHKREDGEAIANTFQNSDVNQIDLKILTCLSMNARMPVPSIAKLAGINEQTAYARIAVLEKKLGINYLLEFDTEALGFESYLVLIKFEGQLPPVNEIKETLNKEPKVQFAAITKGEYDVIVYVLDEHSTIAQDNLWKMMSETILSKYNARWHMIPYGQTYSSVPLRQEFIEKILARRQWHRRRFVVITPAKEDMLKREFLLLKELNRNAAIDFSEIDKKYRLGQGASRYTYHQLIEEGIIIRPTITLTSLQTKYLSILKTDTINPNEASRTRANLLLDIVEDGQLTNKYSLIGNISIPEGAVMFMNVATEGELEQEIDKLIREWKGVIVSSLIVTDVLIGSLYYRRLDNKYSRQYATLIRLNKIEPTTPQDYE